MDEREDGRGAADAERERQDRGGREDARDPELSQRVAKFADECTQGCAGLLRVRLYAAMRRAGFHVGSGLDAVPPLGGLEGRAVFGQPGTSPAAARFRSPAPCRKIVHQRRPFVDGRGVSRGDRGTAHPVSIAAAGFPHEIHVDRHRGIGNGDPEGWRKRLIALDLELDATVADVDDPRLRVLDLRGDLAGDRLPIPPPCGTKRLAPPCADNRLFDQGEQRVRGDRLGDVMRPELQRLVLRERDRESR